MLIRLGQVRLNLQLAETKLVSIKRYLLVFSKLINYFVSEPEQTTTADHEKRVLKQAIDFTQCNSARFNNNLKLSFSSLGAIMQLNYTNKTKQTGNWSANKYI